MANYVNAKRSTEPSFEEEDKVYLPRKNIKMMQLSDKLDFKRLGPFRIVEKVSEVNYQLELPKKSRLHPVFHVSLLEPAPNNVPIATDAELQPENEPDIYMMSKKYWIDESAMARLNTL